MKVLAPLQYSTLLRLEFHGNMKTEGGELLFIGAFETKRSMRVRSEKWVYLRDVWI